MLTSLADVKEYLKINTDSVDDALLSSLLLACSEAIESHCERKFTQTTYESEEYDGTGTKYLLLSQFPVQTIGFVEENGVRLDASQYKVSKKTGTLIKVNGQWLKGDINIVVSYTAGYTEIPHAVQLACKHLVMSYFKSDIATFSTTFQDGMVFRADAMPAQVKMLLAPYKKVV